MDFKGHFAIHGGRRHPLTALDDCSRYNIILAACGDERGQTVRRAVPERLSPLRAAARHADGQRSAVGRSRRRSALPPSASG